MSETIKIDRHDGEATAVVDVIFSPDDGGFYVQKTDFQSKRCWVSKRIYPSAAQARHAFNGGKIKWEV